MKYNILPGGAYSVNTTLGNKSLTYSELVNLVTSNNGGSTIYEEEITYYNDYTWNPSDKASGLILSNNNLTIEHTSVGDAQNKIRHIQGKTTGKYYFEVKIDSESNGMMIGVGTSDSSLYTSVNYNGVAYDYSGLIHKESEHTSYGESWATGDIIGVAFDLNNGRIWFSKNGSWQAGGSPSTDTLPACYLLTINVGNPITYYPALSTYYIGEKATGRFSEEDFTYEIPAGFSAYSISQTIEYVEVWTPGGISGTPAVTLSSGNKLVVDVDLGVRTHLESLAYVFQSTTSGSLPASGIKFSYKDESSYVYTDLVTFSGSNGLFYTTASGGNLFAPRYVRLTHTLGTTSGSAYSFSAFNNDTTVGFGASDELKVQSFSTPRDNNANIKAVPIYNNGPIKANAEISLDKTYSVLDDTIAISISEGGPWSYPAVGDIEIGSNNGTYGFNFGKCTSLGENRKTVIDAYGFIQPEYYSDASSGDVYSTPYSTNYMSRIFYTNAIQSRIFINRKNDPVYTGRLSVDRSDTVDTMEVRSYNSPPASYHIYTTLTYTTTYYYYYYYHIYLTRYDVRDGTYERVYNIDPDDLNTDGTDKNTYSYMTVVSFEIVTSNLNVNKNFGWMITKGSNSSSNTRFVFFSYDGTTRRMYELQDHTTANVNLDTEVFHFKRRADNGIWAYFYSAFMHESDFINKTGHYLVAFDENLSNTFKGYNWSRSVGYMDVAEDSNYLWYTVPESDTIYKMNTAGINELQYEYGAEYTNALGPIAVLPADEGVWFVNGGTKLYKISATVPTIEYHVLDTMELSVDSSVFLMSLDPDDYNYMWIAWGNNVGYLCIAGDRKGEVLFSVYVAEVVKLLPVRNGCWVRTVSLSNSSEDYIKFLSKADHKIMYSKKSTPYTGTPSPIERTHKDSEYVASSLFPEKPYNLWQGIAWQKINLDTFLIPEEKYYQFRLTFWPKEPSTIYTGESDYVTTDDFTQTSSCPRDILWYDWTDKSVGNGLNSVYVNTVSGTLVLVDGVTSPYINTSKRLLVGPNSSNEFDIRVKYKYADGNYTSTPTGEHDFYVTLYPVDSTKRCAWYHFHLNLRPATGSIYYYIDTDVDSALNSSSSAYWQQAWNSTMRIYNYYYNNNQYFAVATYRNNTWYSYEAASSAALVPGKVMYVQIQAASSNTANFYIDSFQVVKGNVYVYNNTPTLVNGIYLKTPVKLNDISPYSYKNIYVKHQVPTDFSGNASYETNLKARWEIPA